MMEAAPYTFVDPEQARRAAADGAVVLIDVREASETDAFRIDGALNLPLSRLADTAARLDRTATVCLLCRSGNRAASAAAQLKDLGHREILVVRGGLEAWIAAGLPVTRGVGRVWSLERQVRFAAGALVALGLGLGIFVHPAFLTLSAFVALGLIFSAVTDTCTMALILARAPWNQGGR